MDRIHKELAQVNRQLREKKIKIFKDEREDMDLHYRYICRGYEDKFAIMREVARASITVKIGEHIKRIITEMNLKRDDEYRY
jgi:galactose-1-phosphate uridylyltransferase